MAALKFSYAGLDEYLIQLGKIESMVKTGEIAGAVIYAGANIVADVFRKEIEGLPVIDYRKRGSNENKLQGITSLQKKGLLEGLGIAKMQEADGVFNAKIGFDGYNDVRTVKNPWGQANITIARSLNSGTSFRAKNPFATRAIRKAKPQAEKAMAVAFDEKLKAKIKE